MKPEYIIVLRHAEKPKKELDPNLAPKGYKRAIKISRLFRHYKFDYIFATKPHNKSRRPFLTVLPLAGRHEMIPNIRFIDSQVVKLAHHILHNKKYDKKKILICWHHGHIPTLIKVLGGPHIAKIDEKVYNYIWKIEYDDKIKLHISKQPF